MNEILEYEVMMTPALVIYDKVKVAGMIPRPEELKNQIQEEI